MVGRWIHDTLYFDTLSQRMILLIPLSPIAIAADPFHDRY